MLELLVAGIPVAPDFRQANLQGMADRHWQRPPSRALA
jgi:hypothetical protein